MLQKPLTNKDWLQALCKICKDTNQYSEYKSKDTGDWSQERFITILAHILKHSDRLRDVCGFCGDILVAGKGVISAIGVAYPFFMKTDGKDGELGMINGVIRVYEEEMDPCEALIQHIDYNGEASYLIRFDGLEFLTGSLDGNGAPDITSKEFWKS